MCRSNFGVGDLVHLDSSVVSASRKDAWQRCGRSISETVSGESRDRLSLSIYEKEDARAWRDDKQFSRPSEGKNVITGLQSPSFLQSHSSVFPRQL